MFFIIGKILWAFLQPLTFIGFLFIIALVFRKREWGRRLLTAASVVFIALGFLPIGPILMYSLEQQNSLPELPSRVDGIIVLGGAIDAERSARQGQVQFSPFAARLTEAIRLSQSYPQAQLVYSGGSGKLTGQDPREADFALKLLKDISIPTEYIIFENASRNTYENAEFSSKLVHPQPGENWVLITSAFHLPRAIQVFEKQNWPVIPYPAGFIENNSSEPGDLLDVLGNYWKLKIAAREYIGIIAYQISGKI